MKLQCECGTELEVEISEGTNPGCAESEDVNCPNCDRLLHSSVYNDARVSIRVIKELKSQSNTKK